MVTELDPIKTYVAHVNRYFGVYMDAVWGFSFVLEYAEKEELKRKRDNPKNRAFISYSPTNFDPKSPKTLTHAQMEDRSANMSTTHDVINRNLLGGQNTQTIKRMVVSSIYRSS